MPAEVRGIGSLTAHRHRYPGVLAPNAPLRLAATAYGRDADLGGAPLAAEAPASPAATTARPPAHSPWTVLIAR